MDVIYTKSTSRVTAQASDIVLRETQSTRLIFRPTILDNQSNKKASVKGSFLFQRKSKNSSWEDFDTIPLSKVKSGEGFKLELKSAELLELLLQLRSLYQLYKDGGVPKGENKYVPATPQLEQLASLSTKDISQFLNVNEA